MASGLWLVRSKVPVLMVGAPASDEIALGLTRRFATFDINVYTSIEDVRE
jgi:hypothetical protein